MPPPPPAPTYTIRTHSSPINFLIVSSDNERIYAGDMSGTVSITSTRTMRPISIWKAHSDNILTIADWDLADAVITHARDNKIHVWSRITAVHSLGDAADRPDSNLPEPALRYSLDVNALNFCRFSFLPVVTNASKTPLHSVPSASKQTENAVALLAIPNLVDSALSDIWELPSCKRIHAAIGKAQKRDGVTTATLQESIIGGRAAKDDSETGILMSVHIFTEGEPSPSSQLRLLGAYEIGSVALYRFNPSPGDRVSTKVSEYGFNASIEGRGWECLWNVRKHVESVMAMVVSLDHSIALSVSADQLVVRYKLSGSSEKPRFGDDGPVEEGPGVQPHTAQPSGKSDQGDPRFATFRIKQPGNASIATRDDGRVCAVGGWDGKTRLYSTKTFKPLGTLSYHTKSCQALAFAHSALQNATTSCSKDEAQTRDEDDELTVDEIAVREKWLVCGSQDSRISIWELMSFEKADRQN